MASDGRLSGGPEAQVRAQLARGDFANLLTRALEPRLLADEPTWPRSDPSDT